MDNLLSKEKRLSLVIETMRFPLIFLVVIAHMVPFDTPKVSLDFTQGDNLYTFVSEIISHNLARLSVRCYFLISGYYLFKGIETWSKEVYGQRLKKKVRTLLIPYLAWNIILVIAMYGKFYLSNKLGLPTHEDIEFLRQTNMYIWLWGGPVNFPLWYMRDLIVMTLLAPAFYLWFTKVRVYGVVPLLILYLGVIEPNIPGLSMTAIAFFGMGAMFAVLKKDILDFSLKIRWFSWIGGGILLFVATLFNGTVYHEYLVRLFILFGVFGIFNLFYGVMQRSGLRNFFIRYAGTTFFIYVTHEIYIINWLKGALTRLPIYPYVWGKLLGYFVVPIVCMIICIALFFIWKKVHPQSLAFLTGGRVSSYVNTKK